MATIDIPGKICPHCGGTRWIEMRDRGHPGYNPYYYCAKKMKEYCKAYANTKRGRAALRKANEKSKQKQSDELTDYYLKNLIYLQSYKVGVKVDIHTITQEQIQLYRKSISAQRKLKQLKHENK